MRRPPGRPARRVLPALCLLFPVLPLAACRTVPGGLRPLPAGDPRPAALLLELQVRFAERQALRGRLRLAVDGPAGSGRSRLRLLAARPARLRVEVRGLLGETVALLVTDGERYALVAPAEGRREHGPVHEGILREVAGLDLRPEEAVSLLLASPPVGPGARPKDAVALGDGGLRFAVVGAGGQPEAELEFDRLGRLRVWTRFGPAGGTRFRATFGDWRDDPGEPFPFHREVAFPAIGARASLSFREAELLPEVDGAAFGVDRAAAGGSRATGRGPAKLPAPGCRPGSAGGGECGSGAS